MLLQKLKFEFGGDWQLGLNTKITMVVDGIDDYLLPYAVKIEAILLLFYNTQDKPLKKKKSTQSFF